jgi:hypothetical protein
MVGPLASFRQKAQGNPGLPAACFQDFDKALVPKGSILSLQGYHIAWGGVFNLIQIVAKNSRMSALKPKESFGGEYETSHEWVPAGIERICFAVDFRCFFLYSI